MTHNKRSFFSQLLISLLWFSWMNSSLAQLEEIVVTAQKREQGVNDVGITLNAFDGIQLENYGVQAPDDLEALVPGLTITNDQPSGVPTFTIRGVGFPKFYRRRIQHRWTVFG